MHSQPSVAKGSTELPTHSSCSVGFSTSVSSIYLTFMTSREASSSGIGKEIAPETCICGPPIGTLSEADHPPCTCWPLVKHGNFVWSSTSSGVHTLLPPDPLLPLAPLLPA